MLGSTASFRTELVNWYRRNRRDLPWRVAPDAPPGSRPDPYHVLVSEAMLQQTQVATVIPYFQRFISLFPTISDLARADEQDVLRLWQGLGYYSRARHLQGTAKIIHSQHGGVVPSKVEQLLELPGIGRYTAGAIASLAFDERAPILDGNVIRVLCRLDRIEADTRTPAVRDQLWSRAEELLPKSHPSDFNSALMELGATICTPKSPKCMFCPVRPHCSAQAAGVQERIPLTIKAKPRPVEKRWTFCIQREKDFLIEKRPSSGRWASMWQFVTVEAEAGHPSRKWVQDRFEIPVQDPCHLGEITHDLTHRRYEFDVYLCPVLALRKNSKAPTASATSRVWCSIASLSDYPLPRPHIRIAALLQNLQDAESKPR